MSQIEYGIVLIVKKIVRFYDPRVELVMQFKLRIIDPQAHCTAPFDSFA